MQTRCRWLCAEGARPSLAALQERRRGQESELSPKGLLAPGVGVDLIPPWCLSSRGVNLFSWETSGVGRKG